MSSHHHSAGNVCPVGHQASAQSCGRPKTRLLSHGTIHWTRSAMKTTRKNQSLSGPESLNDLRRRSLGGLAQQSAVLLPFGVSAPTSRFTI